MRRVVARVVTRLYPAEWRARYGEEFRAMLELGPGDLRTVANGVGAAIREHMVPTLGGNMSDGPRSFGAMLVDARRFWEPGRVVYNFVLSVVVAAWVVVTWPHFRAAMAPSSLLLMGVLGLAANVCYTAAYFVDLPAQRWGMKIAWRRGRWMLWGVGTLFAILLANYWIVDEMYPYVR